MTTPTTNRDCVISQIDTYCSLNPAFDSAGKKIKAYLEKDIPKNLLAAQKALYDYINKAERGLLGWSFHVLKVDVEAEGDCILSQHLQKEPFKRGIEMTIKEIREFSLQPSKKDVSGTFFYQKIVALKDSADRIVAAGKEVDGCHTCLAIFCPC